MLTSRIMLTIAAAGFGVVAGSSAHETVDYGQLLNHKAAAHASLLAARAATASQAYQEVALPASGELQLTNLGQWLPVISTGNVITPSTSDGSTGKILYCPSEADDPAYRAAISAGAGGAQVDYFDTRIATPSVATLLQYDAVTTWANFAYLDPTSLGNNLATYNDQGGTVVLGAFCTYTSGNSLGGTIMTAAYCPVDSPLGTNHFTSSSYQGNGVTCIYNGVAALSCQFRDVLVTQGSGITDGTYADNEICHAYRGGTSVTQGECVYSNGSGAVQLGGTGQWGTAVGNACSCALTNLSAWVDKGSALAGVSGNPSLVGTGDLSAGSPNSLNLTNAAPSALAALFYATGSIPQPFKGGTILPGPLFPPFYATTSAGGAIPIAFLMPALPSGTQLWVQWGIQDAAAIKGVSLSNAVEGIAP
jgi:hypothetical protein